MDFAVQAMEGYRLLEVVHQPIALSIPAHGIRVAESVHGSGFRMGIERHTFHQIYVVQRGHITLEDERLGEALALEAGSLWPIPAGISHRMEDTSESILLLVCLGEAYLGAQPSRTELWKSLCAETERAITPDVVQFTALRASLNRVLAEQWQQQPGFDLAIAAELDQVLIRLARMPTEVTDHSALARVGRVVALVDSQFYEDWNVERAAAQAHLSRRRFTTLFRDLSGESFNTYLTKIRLKHAKALLRGGHHSIPGAAFASGIGDLSHFYRLFKKHVGTTPAHWMLE